MPARYGVPAVTNAVINTTPTPRCERKGSFLHDFEKAPGHALQLAQ